MDTLNNNPNGIVVRKLRKVKRPKHINNQTDNPLIPERIEENNFLQSTDISEPSSIANSSKSDENMNAFNLDSFLDSDNLPTIQQSNHLQQNNFNAAFLRDEDVMPNTKSWKDKMVVGDLYTGLAVLITAGVFLLFGIIFSKIFLSGPTTIQNGLQGVVINPEVPRGRARCGVAEKTQGCVLYIMNPQRQDLNGRDFYDLAAQLTGRQRFMIETGNMRYSNTKIKPGEIAQLNIPPLQ